MKTREPRSDSVLAAENRAQAARSEIPLPEGLELPTEEHRRLWKQYSSMKLARDWRTGDLVQLHDMVGICVNIRRGEEWLNANGWVFEDARGTLRAHPLVTIVKDLRSQRQNILRGIGLNVATEGEQSARKRAPSVADEMAAARGEVDTSAVRKAPQLLAVSGGRNRSKT